MRARVDGEVMELKSTADLARYRAHTIEVVVDRLVVKPEVQGRLTESVELALQKGEGLMVIHRLGRGGRCGRPERAQARGWAQRGPGGKRGPALLRAPFLSQVHDSLARARAPPVLLQQPPRRLPGLHRARRENGTGPGQDRAQPLPVHCPGRAGAVWPVEGGFWYREMLEGLARELDFSLKVPWNKLPEAARRAVLYGSDGKKIAYDVKRDTSRYQFEHAFEGVMSNLLRRYKETKSDMARQEIESFMSSSSCPACGGLRLKREALSVTVGEHTIASFTALPVSRAVEGMEALDLSSRDREIARMVLKEIRSRLAFLENVGLGYLTLSRSATTLSGGESQRIRLATQVGSQLTGVLYVLDEPSIGLHPKDNRRLLDTLMAMRDLGNTVVVVEHDEETIRAADHLVDLGPGAGIHGGEVVAQGTVQDLCAAERSLTGGLSPGGAACPCPRGGAPPAALSGSAAPGKTTSRTLMRRSRLNLHRGGGCFGLGEIHAHPRSPLQRPGSEDLSRRGQTGGAPGHRRLGAGGQGHRDRPGPHRPDPPKQPRRPIRGSSRPSGISTPRFPSPGPEATSPAVSPST